MSFELNLPDEASTCRLGEALAQAMSAPLLVGLSGDLGVGKTTLVRALINAVVPGTRVKSPTYTLVESYPLPQGLLHHLDLYRIVDSRELTELGLDDLLCGDAIVLVEWPEKGIPLLPPTDLVITLAHQLHGRSGQVEAQSERGRLALAKLTQVLSIEGDRSNLSC
ncbi:MAG: tRNA (adenosine(37)-N6)-threonylcarbamoyltransferase complex ATPase subunit type 1 TsaE [Pseudomonadota bacterium]|nr:tRNA (adenosine(37)-N6)-threonylcarbamoyltransferase complex ATPase subunit type 1 TsaE [Pseudomonadota bacterium]